MRVRVRGCLGMATKLKQGPCRKHDRLLLEIRQMQCAGGQEAPS